MSAEMRRFVANIVRILLIGSLVISVAGAPIATPVSAQTTEPATQIYLPEIRQPAEDVADENAPLTGADAAQSRAPQQIDISQVKPASAPMDLNLYGSPQQWQPSINLEPATVDESVAAATLGDEVRWNNSDAELCYIPLGVALNVNSALSLALPPFFDAVPTAAAYGANIGLKFCGPKLEAPPGNYAKDPIYLLAEPNPDFPANEPRAEPGDGCYADFYQPITSGRYTNLFGIPIGLKPSGIWGEFSEPSVYHFNTGVDVTMHHNGVDHSNGYVRLPIGYNTITWRAETLYSPFDFVPIYVPGKGYTSTKERILLATWLGLKVGVGLVGNLVVRYPSGPYNETYQTINVRDTIRPSISGPGFVEVEAIQPGGINSSIALNQVRRMITTSDNCDRPVDLTNSSVASFIPVNDRVDVTWTATDRGPNRDGGTNSRTLDNTIWVTDTLDPVLLAPPSQVLESPDEKTGLGLGNPQVFDLADLRPDLANNALQQTGVISENGTLKFPKGQTLVTWTATDDTGNMSEATQLVNIKGIGENNAPVAESLTGPNAIDATSFNPVSITLDAEDVDIDPLTFKIEEPPDDGFFIAPLLPYFIGDYRITARYSPQIAAEEGEAKALELAADPNAMRDHMKLLCSSNGNDFFNNPDLPKDFVMFSNGDEFMSVDDFGYTYVHDSFYNRCHPGGGSINSPQPQTTTRLSLWDPEGLYVGQIEVGGGSTPLTDVKFDLIRGYIFMVTNNGASNDSFVKLYRVNRDGDGKPDVDNPFTELNSFGMDHGILEKLGDNNKVQFHDGNTAVLDSNNILYVLSREPEQGLIAALLRDDPEKPGDYLREPLYITHLVENSRNDVDETGLDLRYINNLVLDSEDNVYVSVSEIPAQVGGFNNRVSRIYKWSALKPDGRGNYQGGELIGWMGSCDSGPGCNPDTNSSYGYSCTDETCFFDDESLDKKGSGPGQFSFFIRNGGAMAMDRNDILYVADTGNKRIQRFTPDGYWAGEAVSECDGTCFLPGDFGAPDNIAVNKDHFYVLDPQNELLHSFETSVIFALDAESAQVAYQSNNNFVGQDSFTFIASDGLADSVPATVEINVERNFRTPVAPDSLVFGTIEDTQGISLTLQGEDPDGELDTLTYKIVEQPQNGSVEPIVTSASADGATAEIGKDLLYTPDPNFAGIDSFVYAIDDGNELSESTRVSVTVDAINDPPMVSFPEALMEVGLGFERVYTGTIEEVDAVDMHLIEVDWGDGMMEFQGELDENGEMTGPLLLENMDGTGLVYGKHTYKEAGERTLEVCVSDSIDEVEGIKIPRSDSVEVCETTTVQVVPMVDMQVVLSPTVDVAPVGSTLQYKFSLINRLPDGVGGLSATGIVFTDELDGNVQFQQVSPQDACSHAQGTITCEFASLGVGEQVSVTVDVKLKDAAGVGTEVVNRSIVTQGQKDATGVSGFYQTTSVVADGDYIVNQSANDGDASPGDGVCETETGNGVCTLRAAVQEANSTPGKQSISLGAGVFQLAEPESFLFAASVEAGTNLVVVNDDLEIVGISALSTTVHGAGVDQLFLVAPETELSLKDMTIAGGMSATEGGAIFNEGGTVLLEGVFVEQNMAASGGAIYNNSGGTVTIVDSTLAGNEATGDGGAIASSGGTVGLTNVTVSGNTAAGKGGGIYNQGNLELANVTISVNEADSGGGVHNEGNTTLVNTLIANNTAVTSVDCAGTLDSDGNNLIQNIDGCTLSGGSNDITGQDARLAPLESNEGSTPTHTLQDGSPAIDAGTCALDVDQRGMERPFGDGCDIGAVESDAEPGNGPGDSSQDVFLPLMNR